VHQDVWKWRVAAGVQDIARTQNLFFAMPFGRSGVPLISDETMNSTLLPDATAEYLAGDFEGLSIRLATFRSIVSDLQLAALPALPIARGLGTGIANTSENPAADILLLDAAFMEPRSAAGAESAAVDAPDTTAVTFASPKVVTMVADGWFYVQSLDRIGGLKVIGSKAGLCAGMQVLLQGTVGTRGPERVLLMTSCEIVPPPSTAAFANAAIRPLGMPNRAVGGAGNDYLPGFAGLTGLWNGGLLVRTAGKVTDRGDGFFYVDDGSGSRDGTQYMGLRMVLPSGMNPPERNACVAVTGISSWFDNGGYGFPAVVVRDAGDVTVVEPAL
jgi:hypothetical protein